MSPRRRHRRIAPTVRAAALLLAAGFAIPAPARAQRGDVPAAGATVLGTVHDSLARSPLAGARVQLVAADALATYSRSTSSDADGRFAFSGVPEGRYTLGFFHARLDSLGLDPPLRSVIVAGRRRIRADLAIPSPGRMIAAICGARAAAGPRGAILGVVRSAADGSPLGDANVIVEWREFDLARNGSVIARTPRRFASTSDNGFFALCDVPSPGELVIMAARGADSTDWVEIQTPQDGFLRRDLWLGAHRHASIADTSSLAAMLPVSRRVTVGDATVRGTVVAALQGRPIEGALVGVLDGPEARTNERGEFAITNAPAGTRRLLVRAVGYYPAQLTVDITRAPPPVNVSLSTLKAILDTVKITARRVADRYRGFEDRKRSGAGRYYTDEDIARWPVVRVSDIFKYLPGVRVVRREGELVPVLRGAISDTSFADTTLSSGIVCQPPIFLDGHNLFTVDLLTIDDFVLPSEIVGIEVYTGGTVPPQYDEARSGCGVILIWTR